MKILGFIPARSGSERLKNKNLKTFLGKPLIYHTIKFAKKINLDEIFISTDSKKILNLKNKIGINDYYLRPKKYSGNNSQITDVILDGINWLLKNKKKSFDAVMLLQPTTPFRDVKETNRIIKLFKDNKLESLATVSKVSAHPQHIFQVKKNCTWSHLLNKRVRSLNKQDLSTNFYCENGHIYLCKTNFLKKFKQLIVKKKTYLFKQKMSTLDIDYLQDFKICEFRVKNKLFN
jgi:CMP-N-acetylneuraminic acid synthetase